MKQEIPPLSAHELRKSEIALVRVSQESSYPEEYNSLKKGKPVSSRSPMLNLKPFLDQDQCIRVGGRLQSALLNYDEKHPLILSKKTTFAHLLVQNAHMTTMHGGAQLTYNYLLTRFWIMSGRSFVRSIVKKCFICARHRGQTATQIMGHLPEARIKPQRPFLSAGVDFAGPIKIRTSIGRGHKTVKAYICIFVCLVTKAIHLEVAVDLTIQGFLSAFRRFISRRGKCNQLWSDNGTNFRGAAAELKRLFKESAEFYKKTAVLLANDGVTWSFIPPAAPHHGGSWEAGVKSTKNHLYRVIG